MDHFCLGISWIKPALRKGAAIIGQGTTVLHPPVESGVNVPMDICEMGAELVSTERLATDKGKSVLVPGVRRETSVICSNVNP